MRQWAFLTILLYVVCASILGMPVFLYYSEADLAGFSFLYYSFVIPVLVLVQAVLLLVPVAVVRERPIKRRTIVASAIAGAILMGILTLLFFWSVILAIWGEDEAWPFLSWPALPFLAVFWLAWGFLFYGSFSNENPKLFTSTITRWLLKGSILEVIIAIPSHIISRQRQDCCAPLITLLGIMTGLSIALMSFGPGIFFLFAERIKRKRRN